MGNTLIQGGWYALLQGRYNVAEQMVEKAWKSRKKRLGIEHLVYAGKYVFCLQR